MKGALRSVMVNRLFTHGARSGDNGDDANGATVMDLQRAWQELMQLPPQSQSEVANFIALLRLRQPGTSHSLPASMPLDSEPFVGAWKHREDIVDSPEWVRQHRVREWGHRGHASRSD